MGACAGGDPLGPADPNDPAPSFLSVSPSTDRIDAATGEAIEFEVDVESPANLPVTVRFTVDGATRASGTRFEFRAADPGRYGIAAIASDGKRETRHDWTVEVADAPPPSSPNAAPTAVLAIDPASGPAPLQTRVRLAGDDPDGTIVRYRIDISGPAPLSMERSSPIDTTLVLTTGTHDVRGTVEDDAGAVTVSTASVVATPPANQPPVPDLTVDPTSGMAPLDVRIDGDGTDPDGRIVRYELDTNGDGTFDMDGPSPLVQSVRYTEAGQIWVRLRVTDDRGAMARDSARVRVSAPSAPNQPPTLSLDVSPTSGEAPHPVHATAAGADPDGTVASVSIDFDGDGTPEASTSSSTLDADFTFEAPGSYPVRATVTDDDGAVATATVTVNVSEPSGGEDETDEDDGSESNSPPTGSLTSDRTSGDASLSVVLSGSGTDSDGSVEKLEIDADAGAGFEEVSDGRLDVAYPYRGTPYRPRLRITDDAGATTVVDGPSITVHRPVSPANSTGSATGNPLFDGLTISPAIWAEGRDAMRLTITVRDHDGQPLGDVPVRMRSLRPELVAPDGTQLGGTVTIALEGPRTDPDGRITGSFTTRTSTRVEGVPSVGAFVPFGLMVEADAGHGEWRRLPDVSGLNAETVVDGTAGVGQFYVKPAGLTCVGDPLEIHVRALRRSDAPGAGGPADGLYTEIRYTVGGELLAVKPQSGYGSWRTDSAGWIKFDYTPLAPDSKAIRAWVDGQPINIPAAIAAVDC